MWWNDRMPDREEPIEIEVVSGDAIGPRARTAPNAGGEPTTPRSPLSVAVVVGVASLVVGLLVGRLLAPGDSEEPIVEVTPTTEPSSVPRTVDVLPVDDSIAVDGPDGPSTSLDGPSSGLAAATSTVAIDDRLSGVDVVLIGLGDGELYELDIAAGTVTTTRSELLPPGSSNDGRRIVAGTDWVAVTGALGGDTILLDGAGEPEQRRPIDEWVRIPGTDRFWRPGVATMIEVDLAGDPSGSTLSTVGTSVVRADPAGGIIVRRGGQLWSVRADAEVALPPGEPVALSAEVAVMFVCDTLTECRIRVVDRADGTEIDLAVADPFTIAPSSPTATGLALPDTSVALLSR